MRKFINLTYSTEKKYSYMGTLICIDKYNWSTANGMISTLSENSYKHANNLS